MKTYRILSIAFALGLLVSCGNRLDVTNPNKFTVEDINEHILQSGDESKIRLALEGMANTMPILAEMPLIVSREIKAVEKR